MAYYTRTYDPQPTQRVGSTDLKNEFQSVENGLAAAETQDGKAVRAPEAITSLPSSASRALKVLSFDGSGNPRTTIAEVDLAASITAASNAAASEANAASSASAAAVSASTASTQATNASGSAAAALASETAAASSASNAAASASTASTQAGNASTSAANAASSASAASASATAASGSASAAATSATNASNSANAAATSASDAAASFDAFDDRYLGSKASNPTLDNDGNALLTGALYWNSVSNEMRVWNGSSWIATYIPATGYATLTGTETLTNKTLQAAILNGGYTEQVFALTGTTPALDEANGSIQTWTLSANSTPTDALSNGQSLILGITASSFTVTWPSVTWSKVGGSGTAPTLTSSGVNWVILWKVGGTLRGAFLGTA